MVTGVGLVCALGIGTEPVVPGALRELCEDAGQLLAHSAHYTTSAAWIRAADDVRRSVDVFHPQAPGVAALSERVRASFDPKSILNRGRLTRGAC